MSLRTRLIAILGATASVAIALALVFQDRTLARDLRHAASERLERSAAAANRLVDAHLAVVTERYRAISGTPQLRANLEVEDPPTLAHYASDLQQNLGAARILFLDAHGRTVAAVGRRVAGPARARGHQRAAGRRPRAAVRDREHRDRQRQRRGRPAGRARARSSPGRSTSGPSCAARR